MLRVTEKAETNLSSFDLRGEEVGCLSRGIAKKNKQPLTYAQFMSYINHIY